MNVGWRDISLIIVDWRRWYREVLAAVPKISFEFATEALIALVHSLFTTVLYNPTCQNAILNIFDALQ
jgi:hypothetical protein